jgi:3'-phosphoadenosine 5'-phosphosulfate (PAPS) 3'-phosphatase
MDFDIKALSEMAIKAGLKAMEIYDRKEYVVTYKSDNTPVTGADLIADGSEDVYYQEERTHEWDTAAGQTIVERTRRMGVGTDRKPLRYNKKSLVIYTLPLRGVGFQLEFDILIEPTCFKPSFQVILSNHY